ncbi:MAG: hypothetical protein MJK12_04075 [Colwellia sp.]|nr:hypothetical protein [Colwellia sp.]
MFYSNSIRFSGVTLAEGQITIFVNESCYALDGNDKELDSTSLLNQLKKRKVESVLLAVDVCEGPVILANVYVVLSELTIAVIDLKGVGKLERGSCTNV